MHTHVTLHNVADLHSIVRTCLQAGRLHTHAHAAHASRTTFPALSCVPMPYACSLRFHTQLLHDEHTCMVGSHTHTRTPFIVRTDMHRSHIDFVAHYTFRTSRALAHSSLSSRCLHLFKESAGLNTIQSHVPPLEKNYRRCQQVKEETMFLGTIYDVMWYAWMLRIVNAWRFGVLDVVHHL